MKIINIFFTLFFLISCVNDQKNKVTVDLVNSPFTADVGAKEVLMPIIHIESDVYDFIEINQGASIDVDFLIRNVGKAPLLVRSAKGSCGCTVPKWPNDPIAVGDSAVIKVTFNSSGKKGSQNKTVTLVTNAIPSTKILTIKGNVLIPKKR